MADFVSFEVDASGLARGLGIRVNTLKSVLMSKMYYLMQRLKDRIQTVELAGGVLNRQSGHLADSVRASMEIRGGVIVGKVTAGGPSAPYGAIHMQGGQGYYLIYPAEKKALAFMFNGEKTVLRGVLHPPLPKRDFMTPAQNAMEDEIYQGLADGVNEVLRQ